MKNLQELNQTTRQLLRAFAVKAEELKISKDSLRYLTLRSELLFKYQTYKRALRMRRLVTITSFRQDAQRIISSLPIWEEDLLSF